MNDDHSVGLYPIENRIIAMNPAPNPVARNQWEGLMHVGQTQTLIAQFKNKGQRTSRIIQGYVITDTL
ncbi:hypothetical protein ALP87_200211 [Pseudomonas syringae pv. coriandricola]|nr:hypothetical protein ALP87_200211 [Pseudomonas syringae pv. coriandricola]